MTEDEKQSEAINSVYLVRKSGKVNDRLTYAFFGLIYAGVQTPRVNHKSVSAKSRGL